MKSKRKKKSLLNTETGALQRIWIDLLTLLVQIITALELLLHVIEYTLTKKYL